MMTEYCSECDAELEPDEPQTCYFTGLTRHCGDCRDPRTGKPPFEGGCFRPLLCDDCKAAGETELENEHPAEVTP